MLDLLQNVLDNLNDLVYAVDMDTYELLYLNKKGQETFHVQPPYGQKCYELFQNCSLPCAVCHHKDMVMNSPVQWNFYNSVLEKYFSLFELAFMVGDRRVKLEIAIDMDDRDKSVSYLDARHTNMEIRINNAIGMAVQKDSPSETIDCLLAQLGEILLCERSYVFEIEADNSVSNTYEWVREGVTPEKENLQHIPFSVWGCWHKSFQNRSTVAIRDLETIRETNVNLYQFLLQQNIRSIVAVPLVKKDGGLRGFYGIDNLPPELVQYTSSLLTTTGFFLSGALQHRDLVQQLVYTSYHDQQTGLGNRYAFEKWLEELSAPADLGCTFVDISGLKHVNDTLGHIAGDQMILTTCECLRSTFPKCTLFRHGGDEFLIFCVNGPKERFAERAKLLKECCAEHSIAVAVGTSFIHMETASDRGKIDQLISLAEAQMYEDKRIYYTTSGLDRRRS